MQTRLPRARRRTARSTLLLAAGNDARARLLVALLFATACGGGATTSDGGLPTDASFDAALDGGVVPPRDAATDATSDATSDASTDAADASTDDASTDDASIDAGAATTCAPLPAGDARPADEGYEHWPRRLDLIAGAPLDATTREALGGDLAFECTRQVGGASGPVFHRLVVEETELAALRERAATLNAAHPTLAFAPTRRPTTAPLPRADSELPAVTGGAAIEPRTLAPHTLQGAYEYLAAFATDVRAPSPMRVTVVDYALDRVGHADELGHVVDGTLAAFATSITVDREALVTRLLTRSRDPHGNDVAGVFVAADNGIVDAALSPVVLGSGVATGAHHTPIAASSLVWPGQASFALSIDLEESRRISELEAAYVILVSACEQAEVSNHSYGGVEGLPRALEVLLAHELCRDALFVFAAPNAAGFVAATADESTARTEHVLGVTSTNLGTHVHHPRRATGEAFVAAASDVGNSFAAPIVSGVATMLRSIDPSLTPAQTRALLLATGTENAAGDHVLDASAAVLAAIARVDAEAPFSLRRMTQRMSVPLASTRGRDPSYSGTSESTATWNHAGGVVTIARDTLQANDSSPALSRDETEVENGFWSRLRSQVSFAPTLAMHEDTASTWVPRRQIPAIELVPTGEETHRMTGQHRLVFDGGIRPIETKVTTYCHELTTTRADTEGVRLPLAYFGALPARGHTTRTSGSVLVGYARSVFTPGTSATLPAPHEVDVCGRSLAELPADNADAFDAWADAARDALGTTPSFEEHDVVDETFVRVTMGALTCAVRNGEARSSTSAGDVATDRPRQVLDVFVSEDGVPECEVEAVGEIGRVHRARVEVAGYGSFDLVDVRRGGLEFFVLWDPRESGLGALDALLWIEDAVDVLPGLVPPRYATTEHPLGGLGWGMPSVRWAPGVGPVAELGGNARVVTSLETAAR
ncbi:MAG: hypothetical protein KC586_17520 [Myxococcales bacterium]|nr:hypothetical protein [Myxococcales bacterium]